LHSRHCKTPFTRSMLRHMSLPFERRLLEK
jgi:hypothetical protein